MSVSPLRRLEQKCAARQAVRDKRAAQVTRALRSHDAPEAMVREDPALDEFVWTGKTGNSSNMTALVRERVGQRP